MVWDWLTDFFKKESNKFVCFIKFLFKWVYRLIIIYNIILLFIYFLFKLFI